MTHATQSRPWLTCFVCVCGCHCLACVTADGDYGWGLLLRSLADVLQHDRRPAVVDAALEMVFGLLGRYSQRWDAAAWRVLIQRVVRHMLALPPGLSPPAPAAALDSSQVPGWRQNPDGAKFVPSRLALVAAGGSSGGGGGGGTTATTGFGSPVSAAATPDPGATAATGAAVASVAPAFAGGGGGGGGGFAALQFGGSLGAGGAVPAGMSVAEQGLLMTTLLKRMDRYYPLLCDQAASIRVEYQVGAGVEASWVCLCACLPACVLVWLIVRVAASLCVCFTPQSLSSQAPDHFVSNLCAVCFVFFPPSGRLRWCSSSSA